MMHRFRAKKTKAHAQERAPTMALPVLNLPESGTWRTSLILPHLTARFALLRDDTGQLVSLERMQSLLTAQRADGKITEDEEEAVMHEFRLQSAEEAQRLPGSTAIQDPSRSSPVHSPQTLHGFHHTRVVDQNSAFVSTARTLPRKAPTPVVAARSGSLRDAPVPLSQPLASTSRVPIPSDMSAKQIHRISRVLDDLEHQLSTTHHWMEGLAEDSDASPVQSPTVTRRPTLRTNNSSNLAVLSPPLDRSPSAQGSVHSAYLDVGEVARGRTPTPNSVNSQQRGQEGDALTDLSSDISSQPTWSPFSGRFPNVPLRAVGEAFQDGGEEMGSETSSTYPPSFSFASPALNASSTSLGSSYASAEELEEPLPFEERTRPEPFEYDLPPQASRESIAQLSYDTLGGMDLADVAAIQEALIRTALERSQLSRSRSADGHSASESGHGHSRYGASTPHSFSSRLDNVEETDDEMVEQMDTPVLESASASHSPSISSHDAHMITTPPHISPSNSMYTFPSRQKRAGSASEAPPVPQSPQESLMRSTSSRAAISNPAYVPGRRFPARSSSSASVSQPMSPQTSNSSVPLHSHIAAQAAAATEALKQVPPSRTAKPSLKRTKSAKHLRIGAPQLVSTTANLSSSAVRDLPRPASPPPGRETEPYHRRNQSSGGSSGIKAKMMKSSDRRAVPNGEEITPFELPLEPNGKMSDSPEVSSTTYSSPSLDNMSSPRTSSAHPSPRTPAQGQTGLHRVLSRFRKGRTSEPTSPRATPPMSPPLPTRGSPISPARQPQSAIGFNFDEVISNVQSRSRLGSLEDDEAVQRPKHDSDASIRRLREAAAELGIGNDKVDDLLAFNDAPVDRSVVRRTVILASDQGQAHSMVGGHSRMPSEPASVYSASISDRVPTPPPDADLQRKQRSLHEPMPGLPPFSISAADDQEVDEDEVETPLARILNPSHLSPALSHPKASSSYAGSFFDDYDDAEVEDVLASGSISAMGDKRKSTGNLPAAIDAVKSAGARVEVDEMQDGSLVWQVVRNLRASGSSDPPSVSGGFHSRNVSDASSIIPPSAADNKPQLMRPIDLPRRSKPAVPEPKLDPIAFLVRRPRQTSETHEAMPRKSTSSDTSTHVYEATNDDLNHLIDELIRTGDAGSIDLVRQRSIQRVMARRRERSNDQ